MLKKTAKTALLLFILSLFAMLISCSSSNTVEYPTESAVAGTQGNAVTEVQQYPPEQYGQNDNAEAVAGTNLDTQSDGSESGDITFDHAGVNTDKFISDAGIFNYLEKPFLPVTIQAQENGANGRYYAIGYGLELGFSEYVTGDGQRSVTAEMTNYESGDKYSERLYFDFEDGMNISDIKVSSDGSCTLTVLSDTEIKATFTDPQASFIHMNADTVILTRLDRIPSEQKNDMWRGAYMDDSMQVNTDWVDYYSIIPIYGSGDYLLVRQAEHYGTEESDNMHYNLLVSDGNSLKYEFSEFGAEKYTRYSLDDSGNLIVTYSFSSETETYYRCASVPMWGK